MSDERPTAVAALLKLAGERDQPSPAGVQRARDAARRSWRQGLARAGSSTATSTWRPRPWLLLAVAASSVAVLALAGWWSRSAQAPAVVVARVIAAQGETSVRGLTTLRVGEELSTAAGRVALAAGDALSLRLDQNTRVRLEGEGHVTLLQGGLYVDSGGLSARTALRIDTPAGPVRHVGTQYQVRVSEGRTQVQVREGRVALARPRGVLDLGAGDAVAVLGDAVRVEHDQPGHGAAWEWATTIAPVFDIENRPLSEFLAWVAREQGWQLRFHDATLQARVRAIRLHGSMAGLDVNGMLDRVALVTGVPLHCQDGVLSVGAKAP
jgi:ferric-dicitrate binding protein FerR (iron transport regulator)